ncbi:hypothetical protein PR048_016965 [Dryococelus australis]|uniref:Tc1-like transposase DDE domain-containing protein n=1 Tax=Dryococelus australis TaxID=614101 RepID=A0ABQ9H8E4_9NEOP|nr:hypothetical protein PR048_016965 [Dryococelus australis]
MDPCYFQDDNARCHVSRATMQWYADNNPAQIPDLNPIEHLWDKLDRRMMARQVRPKSIAQHLKWLQEEWRRIPVDVLQRLVESMPDRVAAVIAARSVPTRFEREISAKNSISSLLPVVVVSQRPRRAAVGFRKIMIHSFCASSHFPVETVDEWPHTTGPLPWRVLVHAATDQARIQIKAVHDKPPSGRVNMNKRILVLSEADFPTRGTVPASQMRREGVRDVAEGKRTIPREIFHDLLRDVRRQNTKETGSIKEACLRKVWLHLRVCVRNKGPHLRLEEFKETKLRLGVQYSSPLCIETSAYGAVLATLTCASSLLRRRRAVFLLMRCAMQTRSVTVGLHYAPLQRHGGNTARLARRSDEVLGVRVSVARIAPSLLDLGPQSWHTAVNNNISSGTICEDAPRGSQFERRIDISSTICLAKRDNTETRPLLKVQLRIYFFPQVVCGAPWAGRLACPPPTMTNRVQSPDGSLPDFHKWES